MESLDAGRLTDATISIGGIDFRLTAEGPGAAFDVEPGYVGFLSADGPGGDREAAEVMLTVLREHPPVPEGGEQIFDTGSNWKLISHNGKLLMPISSPALKPRLYKMLEMDKDLGHGMIYMAPGTRQLKPHSSGGDDGGIHSYPFQYPLDEVLMVNLLSRGRGVEIHGLGIDLEGEGIIFTGTSGAGKSTLAELWKERGEGVILSDDRLIVRPDPSSGGFLLYGTPWHGDARASAPGGVPLRRILVLDQARGNALGGLSTAEASVLLLVRSFPTFWDHEGMEFTMGFIGGLCESVPCHKLRFRPEQAAIDTAIAGL